MSPHGGNVRNNGRSDQTSKAQLLHGRPLHRFRAKPAWLALLRRRFQADDERLRLTLPVTDAEVLLRSARALLRSRPMHSLALLHHLLDITADARLRQRVKPILSMIECGNPSAADRWLLSALDYEQARRSTRTP